MKNIIGILLLVIGAASCTDANRAKWSALGDSARVTCYSAEKVIFDACSTGKVSSSQSSDGYYFEESSTHLLVEVSGNCVITMRGLCPTNPVLDATDK